MLLVVQYALSTLMALGSPVSAQTQEVGECRSGTSHEGSSFGTMSVESCIARLRTLRPGCTTTDEQGTWRGTAVLLSSDGHGYERRFGRFVVRGAREAGCGAPIVSAPPPPPAPPPSPHLQRARQCLTFNYSWAPAVYTSENWAGGRTEITPARQVASLSRNPSCRVTSYRVRVGVGSGASCRALQAYSYTPYIVEDVARFPPGGRIDGRANCILSVQSWEE